MSNESSLFKESLKYCRLHSRKNEKQSICDEKNVPKELLEDLFGVKIESTQLYSRLKKIFLEDCEHFVDKYYDQQYKLKLTQSTKNVLKFLYTSIYNSQIDKVVTLADDDKKTEHFINLSFFLLQQRMSWSEWLLCMPSGRRLLFETFTFNTDNIKQNIKLIIKMLSAVSVAQQYDNIFFRQEFKFLFNDIIIAFSEELKKQGLKNLGVDISNDFSLWITNQITTEAFYFLLVTGITILSSKK